MGAALALNRARRFPAVCPAKTTRMSISSCRICPTQITLDMWVHRSALLGACRVVIESFSAGIKRDLKFSDSTVLMAVPRNNSLHGDRSLERQDRSLVVFVDVGQEFDRASAQRGVGRRSANRLASYSILQVPVHNLLG